MKIYLVTDGEYSDFCVVAAFSTKEKAERGKVLLDLHNEVLELEVDNVREPPRDMTSYRVQMTRAGNKARATPFYMTDFEPCSTFCQGGGDAFIVLTYARDEQHAIKIANEKRIMELARE